METPRTAPSSTRDYTKIHPRVGDGQAANHQDLRRRSSSCDGVANASPCQQPISFKEYEGVSGNDGSTRSAGIHPTQEKDISVCPRTHGVFYQRQRSKSFSDGSLRQEKWNHWWHLTELVTIHSEEGFSSTDFNHTLRNSIGAPEENEHLRREEQEKREARDFLLISPLALVLDRNNTSSAPIEPLRTIESSLSEGPPLRAPGFLLGRCSFFHERRSLIRDIFGLVGPGWLVAMAYIDPGNLEGDLSAGALRSPSDPLVGYRLLWVLLWSTLMGFGMQRLAIKLGLATGKDLATLCRLEFPSWMSQALWIFTELCLIGADVQAVIGSAIGLKLILRIPLPLGIIVTLLDTFIVLLISTCGTRKLEACFAMLVSLMACCFFANMITSKPNFSAIMTGLTVISIPEGSLPYAVALLGSVIMPHNMFLQSAVVQSRSIDRSNRATIDRVSKVYIAEMFLLLFVSLLINIAVVVAFANPNISSAGSSKLDLYNAHKALESAIGHQSQWIWGVGLLAAGQCSTMACTYAGQFIMEAGVVLLCIVQLGLLGLRIERLWIRVVVTRVTSILPLLCMVFWDKSTVEVVANSVNVMQAFHLPFTLLLLLKFTTSPGIMGPFTLSTVSRCFAHLSGCLLLIANVRLILAQFGGSSFVIAAVVLAVYLIMLGYLWIRPIKNSCSSSDELADTMNSGVDHRQLIPPHFHQSWQQKSDSIVSNNNL